MLIAGLLVFLATHSLSIVAPAARDRWATQMGAATWRGVYSLVALAGFVLLVVGFRSARLDPVVLYVPPAWLRHVSLALMLLVFPMLIAAYLPGRIQTTLKHPMLAAVKTWALAHLLVNGRLADVLLFGSLLAWAVVDRISLKRRPSKIRISGPAAPWNDLVAVVAGLAVYAAFVLGLHRWLFGVSPLG